MKKLLITLSIFLGIGLSAMAQTDLNGLWADSTSSESFQHCFAVFAQKGDSVFVTHYLEFNGQPFVEYGKGVIKGNKVIYDVEVTLQIPGWATAGRHELVLSEDKKLLTGTFTDNKGNTGKLVFRRLR